MKKILEIKNLSKYFVTKFGVNNAVNNVSFDLHKGEIIGLIGQSGSGKTTIGKSLIRIFKEVNGIVALDGLVVSGKKISKNANSIIKKEMQMIFQDSHSSLNEKRNVYSTLSEPLKVHKIVSNLYKKDFSDWKKIINFQELNLKLHFFQYVGDYYQYKYESINAFYNDLNKDLKAFDITKFKDQNVGAKNLISLYFNNKLTTNRKIIKRLNDDIDYLFNFYLKQKENFVNLKNISVKEKKLITLEKELVDYKTKVKFNRNIKKYKLKIKKQESKKLNGDLKNMRLIIKSFIQDAETKIKFYKQNASITRDVFYYESLISDLCLSLIFKNNIKLIKKQKLIKILKHNEIFDLYEELQNFSEQKNSELKSIFNNKYKEDIEKIKYSNILDDKKSKLILNMKRRIWKEILQTSKRKNNKLFWFDYKKFVNLSYKNIKDKKDEILKKVSNIKKYYNFPDNVESEKILKLKNKIEKERSSFEIEKEKFILSWKNDFEKVYKNYKKYQSLQSTKELKERIIFSKKEFKEKLNYFIRIDKRNKNDNYKKWLSTTKKYEEQNKSFNYEEKKLTKNILKFKILFGLKLTNLIIRKYIIKKILYDQKIFDMLKSVGLKPEHAYRYPHEFSGGQKQRISIARALIIEPSILIADEPIASLDVSIQAQIINILLGLVKERNISMIFIGHDLSTIEYLADKIQVLHLGKVVERGDSKEIFKNPIHPYSITLFKSVPKITNANEPFKIYDDQNGYLKDYSLNNIPEYFVNKQGNHEVLATKNQYQEWTKNVTKK